MNTFFHVKDAFLNNLAQLKELQGDDHITQALRTVKEREIGKRCYQAEEELPQAELSRLKDMFGAERNLWETCKQQCHKNIYL
jgi:hypothetical protein